MDIPIHNIETFGSLVFTPHGHTEHKTQRAPHKQCGKALGRDGKPPPARCYAPCGLLDDGLMAVDFTSYRETGRLFAFVSRFIVCNSLIRYADGFPVLLSQWQCFIAKYP